MCPCYLNIYIFIITSKNVNTNLLLKVTHNIPNYMNYYRERTKGSWTLSNGENNWPIADTVAEALKVSILTSTNLFSGFLVPYRDIFIQISQILVRQTLQILICKTRVEQYSSFTI